jgi:hypothetical protein
MTLRIVQPREADCYGRDTWPASWSSARDRWRAQSVAGTWSFPGDWWTSAVDAVIEAVLGGREADAAAHQLGRDRASSAISLAEAFDDLGALSEALAAPPANAGVTSTMFRSLALGWADVTSSAQISGSCVDPLTGFATPAYLRTRLGEIYSAAQRDGVDPGDRHALVVVAAADVAPEGTWARALLGPATGLIGLRETLRSVFSGDETLAATGPMVAVALVTRDDSLGTRHAVLRSLLEGTGAGSRRTWIERLPRSLPSARDLIGELSR